MEVIDRVIAHEGADRVVRHEPEEFGDEDEDEHDAVRSCHRGVVVEDLVLDFRDLFPAVELVLEFDGQLVLADREGEDDGANDHEDARDEEGDLDGPEVAISPGFRSVFAGPEVIAQDEDDADEGGDEAADVAHDVDDAVRFGTEGFRGDVRHEGDRGVAVHHAACDDDGHHDDDPGKLIKMEE